MSADKPKWTDLFGAAPDFEMAPSPKYAIDSGWLVEVVDYHTCGAGGDGYGHEPGCGLVPVADIADLLAARDRRVRGEAAVEFAHWVATHRAHNGSDHQHGQSLYNECINAVLPKWAGEWGADA